MGTTSAPNPELGNAEKKLTSISGNGIFRIMIGIPMAGLLISIAIVLNSLHHLRELAGNLPRPAKGVAPPPLDLHFPLSNFLAISVIILAFFLIALAIVSALVWAVMCRCGCSCDRGLSLGGLFPMPDLKTLAAALRDASAVTATIGTSLNSVGQNVKSAGDKMGGVGIPALAWETHDFWSINGAPPQLDLPALYLIKHKDNVQTQPFDGVKDVLHLASDSLTSAGANATTVSNDLSTVAGIVEGLSAGQEG